MSRTPTRDSITAVSASQARLIEELRDFTCASLLPLYEGLLQAADRSLFELAKQVPVAKQRPYLDAMRLVQTERGRLIQAFTAALSRHFDARPAPKLDLSSGAALALKHPYEVEALILRMETAARVEAHYGELLTDVQQRMTVVAELTGASSESLSPAGLCDSFRDALVALRLDPALLRPLLQIFEQHVLLQLHGFYSGVLERLSAQGISQRPSLPTAVRPARPAAATPTVPQHLDAATAAVLQQVASGLGAAALRSPAECPSGLAAGGSGPSRQATDAQLAALLIQAARGENPAALAPAPALAIRQRVLLVGRMFNEIVADPQFPGALAGVTDGFRFPVLKAALADGDFFTQPDHPVRRLVNEMAAMAATTRLEGENGLRRFEAWTAQALQQAEQQAQALGNRWEQVAPLPEEEIARFLQQQAVQAQERHGLMLSRVRETIDRALEHNNLGYPIPSNVQPLLRLGWAPMMARHLLREGVEGPAYKSGMELLHRVLFALDPNSPNARTPRERAALRQSLLDALTAGGMCPTRARELISGLEDALDAFKARDVPGIGAASAPLEESSKDGMEARTAAQAQGLPGSGETAVGETRATYAAGDETQNLPTPSAGGDAVSAAGPAAVAALPQDLPSPRRLLEQLLKLGAWFRVYDRNTDTTRWLKLASWFPHVQRISFTEFDGTNALTVHARDFLEDVLQGRSDPIDIPPQLVLSLEASRRYYAADSSLLPDKNSLVA